MIDLSLSSLLSLALFSSLCGAVIAFLYEPVSLVLLIIHRSSGRESFFRRALCESFRFVFDALFMVAAGIVGVLLLWSHSSVFRLMPFVFMLVGFLLWRMTLGKLILRLNVLLAGLLKKTVRRLIRLIAIPVRAIKKRLISLYLLTIGRFLGKIKEEYIARRERRIKALLEARKDTETGEEEKVCEQGISSAGVNRRVSFGVPREREPKPRA